jgi:hypothetical protein
MINPSCGILSQPSQMPLTSGHLNHAGHCACEWASPARDQTSITETGRRKVPVPSRLFQLATACDVVRWGKHLAGIAYAPRIKVNTASQGTATTPQHELSLEWHFASSANPLVLECQMQFPGFALHTCLSQIRMPLNF